MVNSENFIGSLVKLGMGSVLIICKSPLYTCCGLVLAFLSTPTMEISHQLKDIIATLFAILANVVLGHWSYALAIRCYLSRILQ